MSEQRRAFSPRGHSLQEFYAAKGMTVDFHQCDDRARMMLDGMLYPNDIRNNWAKDCKNLTCFSPFMFYGKLTELEREYVLAQGFILDPKDLDNYNNVMAERAAREEKTHA
jgi:hypothetical protein